MKKTLFSLLALSSVALTYAQTEDTNEYFGSEQEYQKNYVKFNKDARKFDSWSVGLYGGYAGLVKSEYTSVGFFGADSGIEMGYDVALMLEKHISHTFGIQLYGQMGSIDFSAESIPGVTGSVDYKALSLIGDVNISSIFRRVDNKSRYAWALHGYAGVGAIGYEVEKTNANNVVTDGVAANSTAKQEIDLDAQSMFAQVGTGLQYKLNQNFDIEAKAMYVLTGDDEFDFSTSGSPNNAKTGDDDGDDNFVTLSLGLIYKIGKHNEHVKWYDPLAPLYTQDVLDGGGETCKSGDKDGDTVCDDWDCELDTPVGARIDGCGKALDVDLDGIIDLEDKCVTVYGYRDSPLGVGCPRETVVPVKDTVVTEEPEVTYIDLPNFEFYYDEARWFPEYTPLLDNAAKIIAANPKATYEVEGHTDARGSDAYNAKLSQRRADAIMKYLKAKVPGANITSKGYGESKILNHCLNNVKCTDEEHRVNRRVRIQADQKLVKPF